MSNVGQHLLSGGLSGLASTLCLQPLDLLKTRIQQTDGQLSLRHSAKIFSVAKDVVSADGILGLWRGTVPSLFRAVPGVALYMTSLTHVRTLLAYSPHFVVPGKLSQTQTHTGSVLPKLSNHGNLLAGAVTRVSIGFVLNPFSVIKARFESNMYKSEYRSFPRAVSALFRAGPGELFKGFVPSALRDAPNAGIFVAVYEGIKRETLHLTASSSLALSPSVVHMFSAASAGAIATLVTHPFDVIKTKIQVRREDRYHGLRRTTATIWKQRGIAGFFDGASLRVSRKVLSSAIGWTVYEGVLLFMHRSDWLSQT